MSQKEYVTSITGRGSIVFKTRIISSEASSVGRFAVLKFSPDEVMKSVGLRQLMRCDSERGRLTTSFSWELLQPGVLRLGLLQDGDVGVGVFPEGEEILVGGKRPDAGGVGIRSLRVLRLQGMPTSHT